MIKLCEEQYNVKRNTSVRIFRSFHKNDRSDISANVGHMDRCFQYEVMLKCCHMLTF